MGLIDDGRLYCMEQLTNWDEMEETLLANLGGDLNQVWAESSKVGRLIIARWVG